MKKLNIKSMGLIAMLCVSVASCQKDFDPKSYAPDLEISGYTAADQIAPNNLVAYWSFNGNLKDSLSNTAGVATGTSFGQGIKGQALQGADDSYVLTEAAEKVKNLTSFTVSEWVKTGPPTDGIVGLFSLAKTNSFWGNLEIFVENGSTADAAKLRIHIYSTGDDRTFVVDDVKGLLTNTWANLTVSYNQQTNECRLYVNGSRVKNETVANITGPLAFANPGKIVFGCVQFQTVPSQTSATGKQDWAGYLTGLIDEVRIYNKALTDVEANALASLEGLGK